MQREPDQLKKPEWVLQPVATYNEDLILSFTYEKKMGSSRKGSGISRVTPDSEKLAGLQSLPDRIIRESKDINRVNHNLQRKAAPVLHPFAFPVFPMLHEDQTYFKEGSSYRFGFVLRCTVDEKLYEQIKGKKGLQVRSLNSSLWAKKRRDPPTYKRIIYRSDMGDMLIFQKKISKTLLPLCVL